jgi:hypothetical protein
MVAWELLQSAEYGLAWPTLLSAAHTSQLSTLPTLPSELWELILPLAVVLICPECHHLTVPNDGPPSYKFPWQRRCLMCSPLQKVTVTFCPVCIRPLAHYVTYNTPLLVHKTLSLRNDKYITIDYHYEPTFHKGVAEYRGEKWLDVSCCNCGYTPIGNSLFSRPRVFAWSFNGWENN